MEQVSRAISDFWHLLSKSPQSDLEYQQIKRVFFVLAAPYQGLVFLVATAVLWHQVPLGWLVTFLLLFIVEICVKVSYTNRYKALPISEQRSAYWRKVLLVGMLYSGIVYGLGALVMFHPMPLESLVVVIGVYASTICINTIFARSYLPVFFTTIIPMSLPTMIALVVSGNWKLQLLALMLAGLGLLLIHSFRVISTFYSKLIETKRENQTLLDKLTSEKKQAEQQKLNAEKAVVEKNLFIAAASHDLRQPLHAFGLFLSSIKQEEQSPRSQQLIAHMENSTTALNQLFDDLLNLSKLEAGVVEVKRNNFSINELLEVISNEFGQIANEKNLQLVVKGDSISVYTDKVLLERVLRNLTANALSYTEKGSITIYAMESATSNAIEIAVSDTGCGIPEEDRDKIFSEYHQLDGSDPSNRRGVGLGLAIVDRICKLLGHRVEVDSSVGRGSTFSLSVPKGLPVESSSRTDTDTAQSLTGKRVLIVDDNEDILLGMQLIFNSWGCTPMVASSAAEAVELVGDSSNDPEYLLCDYQLTGKQSGLDVIREINRNREHPVPAAIVTGDTTAARLKEIQSEGIMVLHKPVVPESLKKSICSSLNIT